MSKYSEHVTEQAILRYGVRLTEQHQGFIGSRIEQYREASFVMKASGNREEWQVWYKNILFHVILDKDDRAMVTVLPPEGRVIMPRMKQLMMAASKVMA